jgi:hypothetical protein
MFARDINRDLYRSSALAALLALSLSQTPAHAGGITDMVKGAFVSTGEAIKNTAKAGGDVLRGTAKVGGEAIAGTAHMGEAAAVATGKAIGTTTGAVAGVTGDIITGSAKAVGSTSEAAVGATEDMLGMRKKNTPTQTTANTQPVAPSTRPSLQAMPAAGNLSTNPATNPATIPAAAQAALQTAPQARTLAPLPTGNTTAVHSEVALPRSVPQVPSAFARATAPLPSTVTSTAATTNQSTTIKAVARPTAAQEVIRQPRQAAVQQPTAPVRGSAAPPATANAAAAPLAGISDQAIMDKVLSDKPAGKVSRRNREALQSKPEMTDAQELQSLAPAQISNDITEGTRIAAPVEDSYVSPSWNQQQPIATSAAFAAQYTLHTTPLKAAPAPGTAPGTAPGQAQAAPLNGGAPVPNGLR